jgi:hypothetical protein
MATSGRSARTTGASRESCSPGFQVVLIQDRSGFARPGAANPLGRIEMPLDLTLDELHALLASARSVRA